jgi:hypothetical protein
MGNMGQDALSNNLSNPAKVYLWEVVFTNPIGGGDADTLMLRCQNTVIPGKSIGEILVPFKQTPGVKFPGKLTMSHTWTCTFIEGTDRAVFNALHAWMQLIVHDRLNTGQPDVAIKANVHLRLLDTTGTVWRKIKFVGAYIQDIAEVPIAYEDEGSIMYPATFSFDRWEDEPV